MDKFRLRRLFDDNEYGYYPHWYQKKDGAVMTKREIDLIFHYNTTEYKYWIPDNISVEKVEE